MTVPPLHLRVQRRWGVERRGRRAGVTAVAAAAVGAFLGVGPWLHLGLLAAAAGLAAAWPVRGDERRALRWVGDRVGLAYETAWEHAADADATQPASPSSPAVALRAAVAVEGRLSIRDLTPPPVAAWWLPLGVLALGLWAWAALAGPPGAGGTPWSGAQPPSASSPSGPPAPAGEETALDPATADEPEAQLPPTPSEARGGEAGSAPAGGEGGGEGGDGAASERDALERFLDRVRQRQPDEVPTRVTPAELGLEPDPDAEEAQVPGDPDDARAGERPDGADAERAGDPGDADADEGEGSGEPGETEAGGTAPAPEAPEGTDAGDSLAPDAEGGIGASEFDEGGDEATAGLGVGAAGELGPGTDPAAGEPEPLPSIVGPGPESPVGGVAMPGIAPTDPFPSGTAGGEFRRAVEEALGEGDLPAPYQEIIRNYFR